MDTLDPQSPIADETPGVLRERLSVVTLPTDVAAAARAPGLSPTRVTLKLEKFGAPDGKPSVYYANYVFAGFRPVPADAEYARPEVFNFALAQAYIMTGHKVARSDVEWRAAHFFVYLVPGSQFQVNRAPLMGIYPEGTNIRYRPHMDVSYTDGTCGVWSMTQDDIMADDWLLVDAGGQPLL